jgi:hypothetical protein
VIEGAHQRRFKAHLGWHLLGGALVAGWLAVMAAMFWPAAEVEAVLLAGRPSLTDQESWMGASTEGRRIGSVHSVTRRTPSGWLVSQDSRLLLTVAGLKQRFNTTLQVDLDDDLRLRGFVVDVTAGPLVVRSEGRMEGERLILDLDLDGEKKRQVLSLQEPPWFDLTLPLLLASQDLRPGRRFRVTLFDPQSLSNQPVLVEVVALEALPVEGKLVPATHLTREFAGARFDFWIDERGRVLREDTPLGLSLRTESQEEHQQAEAAAGRAASIETGPAPLLDPEALRRLLPWTGAGK